MSNKKARLEATQIDDKSTSDAEDRKQPSRGSSSSQRALANPLEKERLEKRRAIQRENSQRLRDRKKQERESLQSQKIRLLDENETLRRQNEWLRTEIRREKIKRQYLSHLNGTSRLYLPSTYAYLLPNQSFGPQASRIGAVEQSTHFLSRTQQNLVIDPLHTTASTERLPATLINPESRVIQALRSTTQNSNTLSARENANYSSSHGISLTQNLVRATLNDSLSPQLVDRRPRGTSNFDKPEEQSQPAKRDIDLKKL